MTIQPWAKSYPPGVRWDAPLASSSVQSVLDTAAERFGPLPALEFMDKRISYAELEGLANRAAAGFQKLGVRPGVNVGIFMPNTPHYVIAFFGVLKAGGTVVNYSPLDALPTLQFKVEDSETEFLVTLDLASLYPQAEKLLASTRLKKLIVGEIAEMALAPGPVKAHMAAAGMLAEAARDDRHVAFRDLVDNDGRYDAHPLGDLDASAGRHSIYRRHDRHAQRRDAHARQSDRGLRAIRRDLQPVGNVHTARWRGAHSLHPAALPHLCADRRHAARVSDGGGAHPASALRPGGGGQGHRDQESHGLRRGADDACRDPQFAGRRKHGPHVAQDVRVGRRAPAARGPGSLSEADKMPVDGRLGHERDLADRHVHAARRAGKARLMRRTRARRRDEIHRRRRSGARGRARRARRDLRQGPQRDEGLLEKAGGDGGCDDGGRLLPHWRRRLHGRGRLRLHRRPHQGHAALRRVQRLSAQHRGGDLSAPVGRGSERDRRARRLSRRDSEGLPQAEGRRPAARRSRN